MARDRLNRDAAHRHQGTLAKSREIRLTLIPQLQPRPRFQYLVLLLGIPLFLFTLASYITQGFSQTTVLLAVLSAGAASAAYLKGEGKQRSARVRLDREGIHEDGQLLLPRAKAASAHYSPSSNIEGIVRVRDKTGNEVFAAKTFESDSEALLQGLGIDAKHCTTNWRSSPPLLASAANLIGAIAGAALLLAFGHQLGFLWLVHALWGFLVVSFLLALVPTRILVGGDGVLWQWLFFKRFWHITDIASVDEQGNSVVLRLKSGKYVRLPADSITGERKGRTEAVAQRIREELAEHEHSEQSTLSAQVARAGRSLEEWWRTLRSFRQRTPDYRTAPVVPQVLWRVLEDVGLDASARVGAAAVLEPNLDDAGRARLRELAAETVSPRTRLALESILEADNEDQVKSAVALLDEPSDPQDRSARKA